MKTWCSRQVYTPYEPSDDRKRQYGTFQSKESNPTKLMIDKNTRFTASKGLKSTGVPDEVSYYELLKLGYTEGESHMGLLSPDKRGLVFLWRYEWVVIDLNKVS